MAENPWKNIELLSADYADDQCARMAAAAVKQIRSAARKLTKLQGAVGTLTAHATLGLRIQELEDVADKIAEIVDRPSFTGNRNRVEALYRESGVPLHLPTE